MSHPFLEIRKAKDKGRGLFATALIPRGSLVLEFRGWLARTEELEDHWLAIQVDQDRWLCSHGDLLDDCANHSCEPNAGFLTGEPVLYALRDIRAGEEIGWDYATSISYPGWKMECRCGEAGCRGLIRSWGELREEERGRLQGLALRYLRDGT